MADQFMEPAILNEAGALAGIASMKHNFPWFGLSSDGDGRDGSWHSFIQPRKTGFGGQDRHSLGSGTLLIHRAVLFSLCVSTIINQHL